MSEKFTDLMIDLETLGVGPTAAVMEIGAVAFNLFDKKMDAGWWHHVDVATSIILGGTTDAETATWWRKRGRSTPPENSMASVPDILISLCDYVGMECVERPRVWCKGPAFDAAILDFHAARAGMVLPWRYASVRCVRTIIDLAEILGMPRVSEEPSHHAAEDCVLQISQVWRAIEWLDCVGGRKGGEA